MSSDRILVMRRGNAVAFGAPEEVLRDEVINPVFECNLKVGALPRQGAPFVLPQSARA